MRIAPRLALARTPTPLVPWPRMGATLGLELWCKRDDLTGAELSGNKVRKLEYLLADARAHGATAIITCGGEQSNHARATAVACAQLGLACELLLRTRVPTQPPMAYANILIDRLVGAQVTWISFADWQRRNELMEARAERWRAQGHRPYIIPEGGSNAVGSLGYVHAAEEFARDAVAWSAKPTTVVYACGSGGTGAGLIAGAKASWPAHFRLVGVNVCDDRAYFVQKMSQILAQMHADYGTAAVADEDIHLLDGYVGLGYAKSQPHEMRACAELARSEGVVLDPVYTGKMFAAVCAELTKNRAAFGERIVIWHTGGLLGALPFADEYAAAGLV